MGMISYGLEVSLSSRTVAFLAASSKAASHSRESFLPFQKCFFWKMFDHAHLACSTPQIEFVDVLGRNALSAFFARGERT